MAARPHLILWAGAIAALLAACTSETEPASQSDGPDGSNPGAPIARPPPDGMFPPEPEEIGDAAIPETGDASLPIGVQFPSQMLDLKDWKLTLPIETAHDGSPDEYEQPELATFALEPYFHIDHLRRGVLFRAPAGGATTMNSNYPRTELREMVASGEQKAAWSSMVGRHSMTIRQAIIHLPKVKPHVVAGQIHDATDDVIMVRLEDERLFLEVDGEELALLNPKYRLGTPFKVEFVAANGRIRAYYNDVLRADIPRQVTECYFKAGCYTQSNTERGDKPGSYGAVVIYSLDIDHR